MQTNSGIGSGKAPVALSQGHSRVFFAPAQARRPLPLERGSSTIGTAMLAKVNRHWGLALSAMMALLAFVALGRLDWQYGSLRGAQVPATIGWYLLAFVAFAGALAWSERHRVPMRWVWAAAIFFRLVLLLTTPTLSDDVYRYLWDGHVANHGVSPYAYAIDAPQLDSLDVAVRNRANNKSMASPYLPAGQALFLAVTAFLPLKPIFFQVVMVLFDLASAWLIAHLLALADLPAHRLILYLWNPLVVVEIAHGAHVDAWMVLLALLSITLTFKRSGFSLLNSWPVAPFILALATLTKILPILLLPVLSSYWDWRQRILYIMASIGLLIPSGLRAGLGLTGALTGRGLFGALRIYNAQWNFNSGLFHWLEVTLGAPGYGPPSPLAKMIVTLAMMVVSIIVWWRARSVGHKTSELRSALRLMAVPLMAYLLLSPTVHPWYALLLLALVPFLPPAARESRALWLTALPWIYLSGALVFSYLTYLDPQDFAEREWVRQLEWVPTLLFMLIVPIFWIARDNERGGKRSPAT